MSGRLFAAIGGLALLPALFSQQTKTPEGDWPMFTRDLAGTRYSPLKQITAKNVGGLKPAWTYRLRSEAEMSSAPNFGLSAFAQVTPIVVNGVMYLSAGRRIVALEADTGKEIWTYALTQGSPSKRGVAYWPGDKENAPRIIFTSAHTMTALDAATGKVVPAFGDEGSVDTVVPYNSPPTVFRNLLLLGANVQEQPAVGMPGDTRAYDARTGRKIWEFHSIPHPGEVGHDAWSGDEWKGRSGANNWAFFMTADEQRGILYTVFGSPSSDFYGGDRKGTNLFGNSLVALDAATGKYKWHFQHVHHDLWDYDIPAAPSLVDVVQNGKRIPALALSPKTGYMYLLNRVTGEPLFGVEERPVPRSDVPGELDWPTQPVPVKPPELARHWYKPEDLVSAADTTPEHAEACRELVEKSGGLYNAGPFTPWRYRAPGAPPTTSVLFPGAIGGTNWGGSAVDPASGYVFVNSSEYGSLGWIEKRAEGARVPYDGGSILGGTVASKFWNVVKDEKGRLRGESSWPCQKPPWGHLTAVNANTGEFAWRVRLGITEELPEGKQNTGRINLGGPIVTAGGVVFIGASNDRRFRAFDAKTGKELWATKLEFSALSVPMTYRGKNGRQYVAVSAAGGGGITDPNPSNLESLYVFALP
jgi:quinoprotein glucose dehydrogenase